MEASSVFLYNNTAQKLSQVSLLILPGDFTADLFASISANTAAVKKTYDTLGR